MKYLWLFFLVQGCWYYKYYQYIFYQNLAPWQRPARGDVSNQIAPSACDQSTNSEYFFPATIVRQVAVGVQIWESSSLFVTCLHFCLAPWYLCTCKSSFWYMLACLSTSLKSRHVHVNCSCWSSWLQNSDQRRDGGGDPHTRQESTASSPQKENSLFAAYIYFELLESMHLMCVRCVQRLERLPTLAALGKGQGKLQGEKWSPLSSYQSLSIMYNIYIVYIN